MFAGSGHFSTPNIPEFPGLDKFLGRTLHSHDFRSADEFAGKDVLCVGASYSSEDIGIQCYKYGAKSVTFCWRTRPMGFKWPEAHGRGSAAREASRARPPISRMASSKDVDAIILCTGYLHHHPVHGRFAAAQIAQPPLSAVLYKGIFWLDNPKLMYIGMQDQFYTFNMFDAQAWYARDVVLGRIKLPLEAEMFDDIQKWTALEEAIADAERGDRFPDGVHARSLAPTDYPRLDVDAVAKMFKEWEHHKMDDILTYRDRSHRSVLTGTQAPVHHTPWMKALDNSMEAFLNQPSNMVAAE